MSFVRRLAGLASLVAFAAPLAAQDAKPEPQPPVNLTAADSARYLALGEKYTRWFLTGKADSLAAVIEPASLERLGGIEAVRKQQDMVAERAGVQVRVVEAKLTRRRGMLQYWHAAEFSEFTDDQFVIRWLLDDKGMIVGAGMGPKAGTPPVD